VNFSAVLLRLAALVFLALSLVYNEFTIGLLHAGTQLEASTTRSIRLVQLTYLLLGLILLAAAMLIGRLKPLHRVNSSNLAASVLLLLIVFLLPITIIELALRPFAFGHRKTTIFVQDQELGWKLRPGHEGLWGDVKVSINKKGLRGPEIPYERTSRSYRILYLGDSVTFGYQLAPYEKTFPSRTGDLIQEGLEVEVETINSGVGGYSPWQQFLYLQSEGIRYDPDLVVISFVLNDVTEKFRLAQFGGNTVGFQLAQSATSVFDRFAGTSAIGFAIRKWSARNRFGDDVGVGAANLEALNDWSLIREADSAKVQNAWEVTLSNLSKIVALCEDHQIPVVLVAFPNRYQFLDPDSYGIPQEMVMDFGIRQGIETVNLLSALRATALQRNESPFDYFLDKNHLSERGSAVVAELLGPILIRQLVTMRPGLV
jgi:lysophospholipase L1-like esterase